MLLQLIMNKIMIILLQNAYKHLGQRSDSSRCAGDVKLFEFAKHLRREPITDDTQPPFISSTAEQRQFILMDLQRQIHFTILPCDVNK